MALDPGQARLGALHVEYRAGDNITDVVNPILDT